MPLILAPPPENEAKALQSQLAWLRRRWRAVVLWRGSAGSICLVVGAALAAGFVDWVIHLPALVRALLLVGIFGGAGFSFYRFLLKPLAARSDDLHWAMRVEGHFPELTDALASTVEFMQQPPEEDSTGSAALRSLTVIQTLKRLRKYDLDDILDRRGVYPLGFVLMALSGIVVLLGLFVPGLAQIALWRLVEPFGHHPWSLVKVTDCPRSVAQGKPLDIRGTVEGIVPEKIRLELDTPPGVESWMKGSEKWLAVKVDPETGMGSFSVRLDMTQQLGEIRFRLWANEGVYPSRNGWHTIQVLDPPRLVDWQGQRSPQIELEYPSYTDLPSPHRLSPGTWDFEAVAGTRVGLYGAADRPLAQAWIEFDPTLRTAMLLTPLGQQNMLPALGNLAGGTPVWGKIQAQLDISQTQLVLPLMPWVSGPYYLYLEDHDGLAKEYQGKLRVLQDPVPQVHLHRPASGMSVLPDAEISFKVQVKDEVFAIRSVWLEYRRQDAKGQLLDDEPVRVPIYDHEIMSSGVPKLLAGLALNPHLPPVLRGSQWGLELRMRPRRLDLTSQWALQNRFKPGEILAVHVGADDFNDVFPNRTPGRSHEIQIRIVDKGELARIFDQELGQVLKELERLLQMQENALKMTREVQVQQQEQKLPDPKGFQQLLQAQQLQHQIQEQVGTQSDEGLRQTLARLNQLMRDNKLPPSGFQDRLTAVTGGLKLAQKYLSQAESDLSEATRQHFKSEKEKASPEKDPLPRAIAQQEQAKKSFEDLINFLGPWAGLSRIKGKIQDLLDKQDEVYKGTSALGERMAKKEVSAAKLKAELKGKAQAQQHLAQNARDLQKMMDESKEPRVQKAQDPLLAGKMSEAAKQLENSNEVYKAQASQQESLARLKKMLAALEERREEEIEKLQKKQKQAARDLAKLEEDQDVLRKKIKKAQDNPDPAQRAQELKNLADEQHRLVEEAQKQARELARLRAEEAARALDRAAQEMEMAEQKLRQGEAPQEPDNIQDRLQQAQARLQEAEEELAREQLARIADHIKGLKIRQESAMQESLRLDQDMLKGARGWTLGLQTSLKNLGGQQKDLARETRTLEEKIKGAEVFAFILKKTAASMDKAAEAISNRDKNIRDRLQQRLEEGRKDNEPLNAKELAEEKHFQENTLKHQEEATKRLDSLLDALKDELQAKKQLPKKSGTDGGKTGGGGLNLRAQDGIPPLAQLKALRAAQADINERTRTFEEKHPDPGQLARDQQEELRALRDDEEQLQRILQSLMPPRPPAQKKGD